MRLYRDDRLAAQDRLRARAADPGRGGARSDRPHPPVHRPADPGRDAGGDRGLHPGGDHRGPAGRGFGASALRICRGYLIRKHQPLGCLGYLRLSPFFI